MGSYLGLVRLFVGLSTLLLILWFATRDYQDHPESWLDYDYARKTL